MTDSNRTSLKDDPAKTSVAMHARESALREILETISHSRDDEKPVFDAILENAARLCSAPHAMLLLRDEANRHLVLAASNSAKSRFVDEVREHPHELDGSGSLSVRALKSMQTTHYPDIDEVVRDLPSPSRQAKLAAEVEGMRSLLLVPLVKNDQAIGVICLYKLKVDPFTDDQIALVETFAAQAVIAIENVRQFRELQERLQRERASSEVLEIISQSRDDENPVFEAILENACALCNAPLAGLILGTAEDSVQVLAAHRGMLSKAIELFETGQMRMDGELSYAARSIIEARLIAFDDMGESDLYKSGSPVVRSMVDASSIRSVLFVPLIKDGKGIGNLTLFRREMSPFDEAEISLVQSFAAQAVIAIENVRQFREVQERLAREAASREILEVISRSRDDETPVFEVILKNAARLCHAPHAFLMLRNEADTHLEFVAESFAKVSSIVDLKDQSYALDDENSLTIQALNSAQVLHVSDLRSLNVSYSTPMMALAIEKEGMRTLLYVPLLKDGRALGLIGVYKHEVAPFNDGEIEMMQTFAAQAVIAIENVRQFREVQERLEREEATSDVLKVISQSRDDEMPVFKMIQEHSARLCKAPFSGLFMLDETGENLDLVLHVRSEPTYVDGGAGSVWPLSGNSAMARAVVGKKVINIENMAKTNAYRDGDPQTVRAVELEKIHSFLAVPLLNDGQGVGCIGLYRTDPSPFTDDQVELVKTFAAQAVIAINNIKQFKALESLNAELGDRVEKQVGEIERIGRLKRFLPSAVADTVVSSGAEGALKSHRALLGVLFCDIRGFTAFCETAEPEETIEVLQTYHEEMGKLINAHGAGVDLKMGDGIMVLFNDPIPCEDPAGAALQTALAMRERMADLCGDWRKLGHRLGFGVGISLGYATVGMVGFEGRFDYTASGTAVNLASRLCDHAEDQEILVSRRAATALENTAEFQSAGELTLKGFHTPVDVFRVTGMGRA